MNQARVSGATMDAKGRDGASRPRNIRSGRVGELRLDATPRLEPLRQAGLMALVNQDRQRWFRQLTGLRLTVVWHPDPGQSPGSPPRPCPRAHRLLAAGRSLPDACQKCAAQWPARLPDARARGFHFACALGLTTFVLSPEVAGAHPLSLVLQAPGSVEAGSVPRRFPGAVELVRLIAHELTLVAGAEAANAPLPGASPHAPLDLVRSGPGHPLVAQMLDFARQHYHLPIHLDDVTAALGRSSCYLCNLFSRTVGKTFHHYLDDLRLSRAKEHLGDPSQSIREVAYAVGYTDANYFRRAFKAHTGCAPTVWRQQHVIRLRGENPRTKPFMKPLTQGIRTKLGLVCAGAGSCIVALAQPDFPYIPSPRSVTIRHERTSSTVAVQVDVELPDPCHKVASWGDPVRTGS